MKTVSANVVKQQLGQVFDSARTGLISTTKHRLPAFVVISKEDYVSLVKLKIKHFKRETQLGFDALDGGEISDKTFEQITAEVIAGFKKTDFVGSYNLSNFAERDLAAILRYTIKTWWDRAKGHLSSTPHIC